MSLPLQHTKSRKTARYMLELRPRGAGLTACQPKLILTDTDHFLNLGTHAPWAMDLCRRQGEVIGGETFGAVSDGQDGADLIIYISLLISFSLIFRLYLALIRLEQALAEVVSAMVLDSWRSQPTQVQTTAHSPCPKLVQEASAWCGQHVAIDRKKQHR